MEITYSLQFKKNFNKRIPKGSQLEKRYKERLTLFIKNRKSPILRDHKLTGKKKSFRSFSITGDFRVIYIQESEDTVVFIDIGTHNQVYK